MRSISTVFIIFLWNYASLSFPYYPPICLEYLCVYYAQKNIKYNNTPPCVARIGCSDLNRVWHALPLSTAKKYHKLSYYFHSFHFSILCMMHIHYIIFFLLFSFSLLLFIISFHYRLLLLVAADKIIKIISFRHKSVPHFICFVAFGAGDSRAQISKINHKIQTAHREHGGCR